MDLNHGTRRNRFTVCRVWPLRYPSKKNGAENRNWTRNLLITSQLLYQLSYFGKNKWWAIQDSNLWPPACKADALTNWANRPSPLSMCTIQALSRWQLIIYQTIDTLSTIFYILSIISLIFSLIHKSKCSFNGSNPFE